MKRKFSLLALVSLLLLAVVPAGTALAAQPTPFVAGGTVIVTGISPPIPAGISGRVRITSETLATLPILSSDARLLGKVLLIQQKSNEQFAGDPLAGAPALDGSSKGTFDVVDPLIGVIATGQYHLNVSNSPGCQIASSGNWSTTGGALKGRGTVTACLNYTVLGVLPDGTPYGTFVGSVTFIGTLN